MRPATMLVRRRGPLVELRDGRGWRPVDAKLRTYESMLTEVIDPANAPELLWLREQVRSWRFYDHFRTDHEAPARLTQIGTRTPVLHHDGRDLAAALQTIREIGDHSALQATIADAFPGSELTSGPRTAGSSSSSAPTACCVRWAPRSCPTERCATCCWSRPCCHPGRPS